MCEAVNSGSTQGEPYFTSEDLFSGGQMAELLESLSSRYDRIILDLPPLAGLQKKRDRQRHEPHPKNHGTGHRITPCHRRTDLPQHCER